MSSDPYVYPGTTVLKNIPGIRNQRTLDRFEADRLYMDRGKAVGAEVLSTTVGFLCRVPSVRDEEFAPFSQWMTFWRETGAEL